MKKTLCFLHLVPTPTLPAWLPRPGEMSMGDFAEGLTHTKFKLRLVCESRGEPQGEGYSVKQPKEWVATMLPAMKVGGTLCLQRIGVAGRSLTMIQHPKFGSVVAI